MASIVPSSTSVDIVDVGIALFASNRIPRLRSLRLHTLCIGGEWPGRRRALGMMWSIRTNVPTEEPLGLGKLRFGNHALGIRVLPSIVQRRIRYSEPAR